jgi:stalled ribosome rescue protein Dom34
MPYLAQRATDLPHVVVVTDRTGADVLAVRADGDTTNRTVDGRTRYPMHRTATADWSERHFQLRVENSWQSNARDVAAAAGRVVSEIGAELVVVAGDVRARHMVGDELCSSLAATLSVAVIDEGSRAAGSSAAALEAAVRDQVLHVAWRKRREVLEHLRQNLGRREYAAAGVADVTEALRMAQADTVVVSDDASSTLRAWVGRSATEFGLAGSENTATEKPLGDDRYDAALVRAVVGTGARLLVTPGAHEYLPDGIGALLRYDTARAD